MSHNIFVQNLPPGIRSVDEIPDDFEPGSIGARSEVIGAIKSVVPSADFTDPSWGKIIGLPSYYIEVNLGESEVLDSFAFHVTGGLEAMQIITRILQALNLRALDSEAESGLFQFQES